MDHINFHRQIRALRLRLIVFLSRDGRTLDVPHGTPPDMIAERRWLGGVG
jgi:hypothetical protein